MNVVILVSVISVGNSGVFGGSRTLTALVEQGYAPKIFAYVDRSGRPLVSTITIIAFSCLAYINMSASGPEIFTWLLALSSLAAPFTWGSICLAHIRFRQAWAYHGHTLDEIPFKSMFGVTGSYFGLALIFRVPVAQVSYALFSAASLVCALHHYLLILLAVVHGNQAARRGHQRCLWVLPVLPCASRCWTIWINRVCLEKKGWLKLADIDVDSGRRRLDWKAHHTEEKRKRNAPLYMRIVYFMF